jgi:hypothetical protein
MTTKFEAGDRVRVVAGEGDDSRHNGKVGVIEKLDAIDSIYPYLVRLPDALDPEGDAMWAGANEIELVSDPGTLHVLPKEADKIRASAALVPALNLHADPVWTLNVFNAETQKSVLVVLDHATSNAINHAINEIGAQSR